MIDARGALFDLADHLDHPAGADLAAFVRGRIAGRRFDDPRAAVRTLLAVAASC